MRQALNLDTGRLVSVTDPAWQCLPETKAQARERNGHYVRINNVNTKTRKTMSDDIYLMDLTVGEFRELVRNTISDTPRKRIVRGIKGIAEALHVSEVQAKRIKKSGVIDKAITQYGRVILTDADYAVALYSKTTSRTNH